MIKSIKTKVFSIFAITYAFTSSSAIATDNRFNDENNNIDNFNTTHSEIKEEIERISYLRNREVLNMNFESGEELSWKMENEFSIFESATPFGTNDKGLLIKTEFNHNSTFANNISDYDIKVKSNDLPAWLLSRYDSVEEIRNNIENISIVKETNDHPLRYFIVDEKDGITIEIKDSNPTIV